MHILGFVAENYKRLRIVEIQPKGRMIKITGKNGQGKTSVLDALWAGLVGSRALPEKPVRKGSERAKIKLNLGEYHLTRTITPGGQQTLKLENAKGTPVTQPQSVLDELLGELTFDPLEFVSLKPKQQVEMLRKVAKLDIDVDQINADNAADYQERTSVNRDVSRLETEVAAVVVQDGLPAEKLDEAHVMMQIEEANATNKAQQQVMTRKTDLSMAKARAEQAVTASQHTMDATEREIKRLQDLLKVQKKEHEQLTTKRDEATAAYDAAPNGETVDLVELTRELQRVQLVNREIDKRSRRQALQAKLDEARKKADQLTRAIEDRNEKKTAAVQSATMPVPGLSFDENQVMFNGIPLDQLGEAEQIRISTSIAMAANPKLRILRILHGEALDDDSLQILAEMAEQHDFQIWMAKVDSSGKCGIVMEDGMVKDVAE